MHLPGPRAPFRLTTGAAPAPAAPRAVPSAPQGATRADEIRLHRSPDAAFAATAALREEFVRGAPRFASGDVAGMTDGDLARLFALYDREAFRGALTRSLAARGATVPACRFSRRLTAAAGRTVRHDCVARAGAAAAPGPREHYTIEISVPLLLYAFDGRPSADGAWPVQPAAPAVAARPVRVGGRDCRDRLDVLLRVFEHELVHLLEMARKDATDCRAPTFHFLASLMFGHIEHGHGIPTPREKLRDRLGITVGDLVSFPIDGRRLVGRITSIRRRATVEVLSPCPDGGPAHLHKYGVPVHLLERADAGTTA